MQLKRQRSGLLAAEYSGTARSGKGTIVAELAKQEGVACDETGADYRTVARVLIAEGAIELGMDEARVARVAASLDLARLTLIAATKQRIISEHGLDSLYKHDVNTLVPHVGKVEVVRKAVKAGFKERIAAFRDDPKVDLLLVDGRNLKPTVEAVPGVHVFLRTFVQCDSYEAARRECLRDGVDMTTEGGQRHYEKVRTSIQTRNKTDASRTLDPVRSEADALVYGDNEEVDPSAAYHRLLQIGLGNVAVRGDRQIVFDTTRINKNDMLYAARQMLEEGYSATTGLGSALRLNY